MKKSADRALRTSVGMCVDAFMISDDKGAGPSTLCRGPLVISRFDAEPD